MNICIESDLKSAPINHFPPCIKNDVLISSSRTTRGKKAISKAKNHYYHNLWQKTYEFYALALQDPDLK